ncbi:MAG: ABC transporter permease [Chloroflexi bacterium]|nr:MAG: ABC transporter permease [Chloroflexota bacterium]
MRSGIATVFLIARRDFITRVRTRLFLIGTILILVAIAGYVAFQVLVLSKQGKVSAYKVAYVGGVQSLADPLAAAVKSLGFSIERKPVRDQAQGETEVRNGSLDVLMSGSADSPQVLVRDQFSPTLAALLNQIVQQRALDRELAGAGLNPAQVEARVASARVQVHSLKPPVGQEQRLQAVAAGFVAALFLYMALLTYGNFIAQGVVEEKANRIVEILLSTVRPEQLLIGKVVGIGLVGLLQFVVIGIFAFVVTTVTHVFTVPTAAAGVVLAGLLWFVLGYFLYAIMFAAGGSLVSRQEEVQSVVFPITMLAILAWFVAIGVLTPMFDGQPMSNVGIILGMIPFFSPVLLPTGMATGDMAAWQVLLAVVLTLGLTAAATWLAARIYANSVLRLGARVKLREALRGG